MDFHANFAVPVYQGGSPTKKWKNQHIYHSPRWFREDFFNVCGVGPHYLRLEGVFTRKFRDPRLPGGGGAPTNKWKNEHTYPIRLSGFVKIF